MGCIQRRTVKRGEALLFLRGKSSGDAKAVLGVKKETLVTKKYKEKAYFQVKIVDNADVLCYIYSARLEKVFFLCLKKTAALVVIKEVAICVQELL